MGKLAAKQSLESVRRKMLMQEDVFRKQVRELHRLYGTQKQLMGELKKEMEHNIFSSPMKTADADYINWPHQMDQTAATGRASHFHRLNIDQSSLDRSASSSGDATRIPRGLSLDLEIKPSQGNHSIIDEELSCPILAAPAKGEVECINNGLYEESNVELTLSIGRRSSRRKSESCSFPYREPEIRSSEKEHSSASVTSDHRDACNSKASNMGGSSTTSDQERRRPRWPFQV